MDVITLIETLKNAPLWLKIDIVVIQLATFYTAVKAFIPVFRWISEKIKNLQLSQRVQTAYYLCFRKPKVRFVKKPSIMKVGESGGIGFTSAYSLNFQNRDTENVLIDLNHYMLIMQGFGLRKKRIRFVPDFNKTPREITLSNKGDSKTVEVYMIGDQ